jgi:O-antigen ligase
MVRKHGMASVFSNQNIYGTLNSLFFIYIILIKKNFKSLLNNYLMIISLILSLTGIFLSLSINAILTLLVGCIPVISQSLKQKNNLKWFALFILSFFIIVTLSLKYNYFFHLKYEATISSLADIIDGDKNSRLPPSLDGRLKIWYTGIDLFMEKPVFGWGSGMTSYSLSDRIGNRHLHNCYLDILVNNGITGFLVFIWMLSIWLYGIRKNYFVPLILSLLFSCLFDTFLGVSSWLVFTAWITASTFIKHPPSVEKNP